MCKTPNQLNKHFGNINKNYYISNKCPYGDGKSSGKIKKIIQ